MDFMLDIDFPSLPRKINYRDPMLLVGSCFTEHIGAQLQSLKFEVMQNPNGILFDPHSVSESLVSYIQEKQYTDRDLFFLNEVWQSWHHHGTFSRMDPQQVLKAINDSQQRGHDFLWKAKWLIITLGSSYSYRLTGEFQGDHGARPGMPVANCHRAPSQWFKKHLMTIEEINAVLDSCIHQLFHFNPDIRIIFSISPVRHIRDGVVENNRSKARLIEVVHHLVGKFDRLYYFPAYELLIDVLRDYRFYDVDMVHPNYQATSFVLEKFMEEYIDQESQDIARDLRKIVVARKHRAFHPGTEAHRQFLKGFLEKTAAMKEKYPFLDLEEEMTYFSGNKPGKEDA